MELSLSTSGVAVAMALQALAPLGVSDWSVGVYQLSPGQFTAEVELPAYVVDAHWTNQNEQVELGNGWEPMAFLAALPGARALWRLDAVPPNAWHVRVPGQTIGNLGVRWSVGGGRWSPVSTDRKTITF